jgi:sigma-B regulation protein RsbU (phosphoserine phosphatase)
MTADQADQRAERALVAHVQQELTAPATAILGYAEMLMDDALEAGRDQFTGDLQHILDASRALDRLVVSLLYPAPIRWTGSANLAEFRRTLRHDLRTPINAIKGYGEMLREDAADAGTETFVTDLDKLLGQATLLLDRIDNLVMLSGGDPALAEGEAGTSAPAKDEAELAAARPSRILVVDDDASNRDLLSRRVQRLGHRVLQAKDGVHALALVETEDIDLVLIDMMMPGISGYDVLALLKRDPRFRELPVIMISALTELDAVVRCIEAGADDYLTKPFNPILLRARVGASLEKKRLRDEVRSSLVRLEAELDAARKLQLGMLPRDFPRGTAEQPVELHALMEPAREVGGDFYDCFYVTKHLLCFLVGDVSGKGAAAAMFMARTSSLVRLATELLRPLGMDQLTPARIAEVVNYQLCQNNEDMNFVTLFLGLLDIRTGMLVYTDAGHPAPHVMQASGDVVQVECNLDLPLGVSRKAKYRTNSIGLAMGDAMVVVSDGVEEAQNAEGAFYTIRRLDADLRGAVAATPQDLVRLITNNVNAFTGSAPRADDVTVLALRWDPRRAEGAGQRANR